MLTIEEDEGWNEELVPGAKSRRKKLLDKALIQPGLVTYYDGTVYIFLAASNSWASLISAEGQSQICDITGCDNVSVNYMIASEPHFDYMENNSTRVSTLPVSICIGTRRRIVSLEGESMRFKDCEPLIPIGSELDSRLSTFCLMPCSFRSLVPSEWIDDGPGRLERFIMPLFSDLTELETFKWICGGIALDPSTYSRLLLLYGDGNTGKSTIINVIMSIFKGCSGAVPTSTFIGNAIDLNPRTAQIIASKRVVTSGELKLNTEKLNIHIVKEITGHDKLSIPPITVTSRCTMAAACNYLPDPEKDREWYTVQVARRVVIIPFHVDTNQIPSISKPDEEEDNIEFLMSCIYTRLKNSFMPISIRSLLMTILGSRYLELSKSISEMENPSMQDTIDANTFLECEIGIGTNTIGSLASHISENCIVFYGGIPFINYIKYIST